MKSRSELRDVIVTVTYQSYIMEVANLKFSIDKLIDEQPDIYKNEELLFIEIKGWKKYLEYHLHDISQKDIKEQITKYKLEKKLQDSLSILDILVSKANISDPHLFKSLPKQYIIVTDISTENYPLEKFAENLTFLATFSSGLNLWDATKEQIERFPSSRFSEYNISGPFLVYCKDFDRFIL